MPDRPRRQPVPAQLYAGWSDMSEICAGMAAAGPARNTDVQTHDISATIMVRPVTPGLFPLLGVAPSLGRTFSSVDSKTQESSPVVLSYQAWQRIFGGNADALGAVLWIEDSPHTVIGVMPKRFWFTHMDPTVWTPLDPAAVSADDRLEVVVRRKPGISLEPLAGAFQSHLDRYASTLPLDERGLRLQMAEIIGTPASRDIGALVVWLFETCVLLTLLISCTNVSVLMIAHWTARERELAIHAALGAGRARILRSLVTESVFLATLGGVSGLGLTYALFRYFIHHGPPETEMINLSLDFNVLIQTAAVTCLAGILTGSGPALLKTRNLHANPMRLIPSDRTGQRWRHGLVIFEISVTMALLIVTSIMFDGYRRALSPDQGFDRRPLVAARVEAAGGVKTLDIRERLGALPGVSGAAAATSVPLAGRGAQQKFARDAGGSEGLRAEQVFVTSDFFATLGVPIRSGRGFSPHDDESGGAPIVIINEAMARRLSPGRNPVGTQVWSSGKAYNVVGVVADYLWMPLARPAPAAYLPLSQQTDGAKHMQFVVRAAGSAAGLVQTVAIEVRRFRPDHVVSAFTMQSVVDAIGGEIVTIVYPMTVLMAIGIFLSAAGIYAVLAFAIARRSKEIALRMAIGATHRHVLRLVASLSLRLLSLGIVFGTALMYGLSRLAQGSGGVFDSRSSAVFAVPILVLLGVGVLATWIPLRRAIAIDPAALLRMQ
jgi:predicted permease